MQTKRRKRFDLGFYLLLILVFALGYYVIYGMSDTRVIPYSEARILFEQERVRSFRAYDTTLTMEVRAASGGGTSTDSGSTSSDTTTGSGNTAYVQ